MKDRSNHIFFATLLILLMATFFFGDKVAAHFFPGFEKKGVGSAESTALDNLESISNGKLIRKSSPKQAKSDGLFWIGNIEGKGLGIDVLADVSLLDSVFPGYGQALYQDKKFWNNYFKTEFGPNALIQSKPNLLKEGFRVSYSWTGCFSIYEKYGADVLVLGSSEVYMGLIPGLLAEVMTPLFTRPPKVLFCVTPAMSAETVKLTAQELIRLHGQKPQIIIWGYSFWAAYTRSTKLAGYQNEKNKEFAEYFRRENLANREWYSSIFNFISNAKGSDFFPKIGWDDVLEFSVTKARSVTANQAGGDAEGVNVRKENLSLDDAHLSAHLRSTLKPYYDITRGITVSDCLMGGADAIFEDAAIELKQLSPNVFVYLAPTTLHHRRTVPECFLPNVKLMLTHVSEKEGIHLLATETEGFGLGDRDFIHPTLDSDRFYFDINHTNYFGAQKITREISSWIESRLNNSSKNVSK